MLQGEHSATLSTFIELPSVIKIFILYIFEWPYYTGFTVLACIYKQRVKLCVDPALIWIYNVSDHNISGLSMERVDVELV